MKNKREMEIKFSRRQLNNLRELRTGDEKRDTDSRFNKTGKLLEGNGGGGMGEGRNARTEQL